MHVGCDCGNASAHGLDGTRTEYCQLASEVPDQLATLGVIWETGCDSVVEEDGDVGLLGEQLP